MSSAGVLTGATRLQFQQSPGQTSTSMKVFGSTAASLGLLGVVLGAMGAHAWRPRLEALGSVENWQTAVLYHLVHAVALFALCSGESRLVSHWARWIALAWTAGIVLFSGSIYLLSLGGPRWLGPVTPLGGVALVSGWALAAIGLQARPPAPRLP